MKHHPTLKLPATITRVFEAMEVADALCNERGNPPGLFMALQPPALLEDMLPTLYVPHARELSARYDAGGDLAPATKAEILAGLQGASLRAPLDREGLALMEQLFYEVTGTQVGEPLGRELYPGQLEEMLDQARHQLRDPSRKARIKGV